METDWRAVGVGVAWGLGYLAVLSVPVFSNLRWLAVPLVLATGLLAGAAAGGLAGRGVHEGGRHGLISGGLTGAGFAVALWVTFSTPGATSGVFWSLEYLLATSAGRFPVVATHGRLVVGALAVLGGLAIALLGEYAGRRAPAREGGLLSDDR